MKLFSALVLSVLVLLPASAVRADPLQLFNLPNTPTAARFTLSTSRVWPTTAGQPSLCLWDGDRYAALSISIDDNSAPDHSWWLETTAPLGIKVTWFVITSYVGTGGYWGTWAGFDALRAAGHHVQSHTITHLHADDPDWPGILAEYRDSITAIENNMPGNKVLTLAYPGGTYSYLNDRTIAAQYYIAARGTVGSPNLPNQIDYLSVHSASGGTSRAYTDAVLFGTSTITWMNNGRYLRSWICAHYHGVTDRAALAANLAYIKSVEADLWTAPFEDVARFGQERDTARLTLVANTADEVRFNLSDDMMDTIYDYPLTIKVRLYPAWESAVATQGGQSIPVEIVTHDGAKFALIRAVPDRGEVSLTPWSNDFQLSRCELLAVHGAAGSLITQVDADYCEPRAVAPDVIQLVFTRALNPATVAPDAVTLTGQSAGDLSDLIDSVTLTPNGDALLVQLTAPLPDGDRYTIALSGDIGSAEGYPLAANPPVTFAVLAGDVDASGTVTSADLLALRAQLGRAATSTTAPFDVDCSGTITAADLLAVRSRLGAFLP